MQLWPPARLCTIRARALLGPWLPGTLYTGTVGMSGILGETADGGCPQKDFLESVTGTITPASSLHTQHVNKEG
jgi:hypothetical protein